MKKHRKTQSNVRQSARTEQAPAEGARTDFVMERFGKLEDAGRDFDIAYWQRQGDAAIFRAAWELVEEYHRSRGLSPDELRLQKSIEHFQRI